MKRAIPAGVDRRSFLAAAGAIVTAGAVTSPAWWRTRRAMIRLGLVAPPANLLRNAGFQQSTVEGIPDYWGTAAPADLPDFDGVMRVVEGGPIEGARTLHLRNTAPGYRLSVHSMKTFVPEPRAYTFSVYLRRTAGRAEAMLSMGWDSPKPYAISPTWRRYELTYTPALESRSAAGLSIGVWAEGSGAIDVSAPQLEEGDHPTPFDVALMDDHPLPVVAWPDADRDVVAAAPVRARDRSLRTTPAVVFGIALHELGERQLDDICHHGFNTVVLFIPIDTSPSDFNRVVQQTRAALDAASRRSLRGIACLTGGANLDARRRDSTRMVDALKDHPAILAWMFFDEPSRQWAEPPWSDLEALYRAVKAADPDRPAFINDNTWSHESAPMRQRASDIASIDVYPIGSVQNPLAIVSDFARVVNVDAVAAGKPSAFWLQLYGWNDVSREPMPSEARAMAYLSFIWGTRVFLFWAYKPMQRALWDAMRSLAHEVAALDRALADAGCRWVRTGTSGRRVHYTVWEGERQTYVIACNASSDPVLASFDVAPTAQSIRGRLTAWHRSVRSMLAGDQLLAWFGPYSREVFEFAS